MAASSPAKNKAKKTASPAPISTKKTWKRNKGEDLLLPSGNTAFVKRPGPTAFLTQGLLPDSLTPIVQDAINTGKGIKKEKMNSLTSSPEGIASMLDAMDKVLASVVMEPKVLYHRRPVVDEAGEPILSDGKETFEDIPEEERDDDLLYTDDVDLEDKMFVFNFAVGGTRDLERFREEHAAGMGDIHPGEASEDQSE